MKEEIENLKAINTTLDPDSMLEKALSATIDRMERLSEITFIASIISFHHFKLINHLFGEGSAYAHQVISDLAIDIFEETKHIHPEDWEDFIEGLKSPMVTGFEDYVLYLSNEKSNNKYREIQAEKFKNMEA